MMMIALVERWHSKTSLFHLPIGEATITLEDVWRILSLPIHGELVTYHVRCGTHTMQRVLGASHFEVRQSKIDLSEFSGSVDPISLVLRGLISRLVVLDRRRQQFPVGWGVCIKIMLEHGT